MVFTDDICLFKSKKWISHFFTKIRFMIQKNGNFLVEKVDRFYIFFSQILLLVDNVDTNHANFSA